MRVVYLGEKKNTADVRPERGKQFRDDLLTLMKRLRKHHLLKLVKSIHLH